MRTGLRETLVAFLLLVLGALAPALDAQDAPNPIIRTRIDAFFAALAANSPEQFEAMAREHGTAAFRQRRTPAERAEILRRLRTDFGAMTLRGVRVANGEARLDVTGATGLQGTIALTLAAQDEHRIDRFGVDVRAGGQRADDGPADPPPPVTASMSDEALRTTLDTYLTERAADDRFAGVVLISRGGSTGFAKAYGLADREHGVANGADTRFNIGSINKSFTQVAIAQLLAAGRLKATDTVGALLPDHPNPDAHPATVQQLLDHQGGIADFFGPGYAAIDKTTLRSNSDYYRLVASRPLTFAPGTGRRYCNGCYIVLGEIISRVSGQTYESYVTSRIFEPAGMRRSGFLGSEPRTTDVARGYTRRTPTGNGPLRSNAADVGARGSAAGGAYATAADLVAYVTALREHRLLNEADARRHLGPQADGSLALAGGAPGLNAFVHARGDLVVVVLANVDPPAAERFGEGLASALTR